MQASDGKRKLEERDSEEPVEDTTKDTLQSAEGGRKRERRREAYTRIP